MLAQLHLLEGLLQVVDSTVAANPLEASQCSLVHGVCIVKGLDGILVCSRRHEKVSCVDVYEWILLVSDDQLLKIMECKIVITQ